MGGMLSAEEEKGNQTPENVRMNKLLESAFALVSQYLAASTDEKTPVVRLASPEDIEKAINVSLTAKGRTDEEVLKSLEQVLHYSMRSGHPNFHNQLFAACHPLGIVGELCSTVANSSMYTFEVAPSFLVLEREVFNKMHGFLGWEGGDGMFCPGGSMSNFYGMNLARFWACRRVGVDVKKEGMRAAPDLVAFVSEQGHYSAQKAAAFLGLGTNALVKVAVDCQGRMLAEDLKVKIAEARKQGRTPFYVQATAATTVLGGFDDFNAICDVAYEGGEDKKLWVHVDGCWGASVVLSPNHRHLMEGVKRCDSLAWNPHKLMGIPLQCSAFLLPPQHYGLMESAHSAHAKYLFQPDKLNATLDTGDKSVQCGRKVDVLKLWAAWASLGDQGYADHIDYLFTLSTYLEAQIKERKAAFRMVSKPMCTNVCFWYIPPSIRAEEAKEEATLQVDGCEDSSTWSAEKRKAVHDAAVTIKERMQEKGSLMIGFQSITLSTDPNAPNFFRMVIVSGKGVNEKKHMDFLLDEIDLLGADL